MNTKAELKDFENLYQTTYNTTLKFIIVNCNNLDDINDIIQDTYIELLNILKRKKTLNVDNIYNYIIGISKNIIKRYYFKKKKDNIVSLSSDIDSNTDYDTPDSFDLESTIITKDNVSKVWDYLKNKDLITSKIFYLYFALDLKISDISKQLKLTDSNVKNRIYRTLKELKSFLKKGCDK